MAIKERPQFVCATKRPVWSGNARNPPKRGHLHPGRESWMPCTLPTFAAEKKHKPHGISCGCPGPCEVLASDSAEVRG